MKQISLIVILVFLCNLEAFSRIATPSCQPYTVSVKDCEGKTSIYLKIPKCIPPVTGIGSYVLATLEGYSPKNINAQDEDLIFDPSESFDNVPLGDFNLRLAVGEFIGLAGPWDPKWTSSGCCSAIWPECQSECAYISGCDDPSINYGTITPDDLKYNLSKVDVAYSNRQIIFTKHRATIGEHNNVSLSLLDIQGKLLFHIDELSNFTKTIAMPHNLNSGIYLVSLTNKISGEVSTKTIFVN